MSNNEPLPSNPTRSQTEDFSLIPPANYSTENLSRVQSAATEPIHLRSEALEKEITPKQRGKFQRAQTAPLPSGSGKNNNNADYLIPEKLLERKPTVKKEVSVFYTIIQYFDALKDQTVDKSVQRADQFYNWFWNLSLISSFVKAWRRWETIPVLGHFLQILRCFTNTRAVLFFPCFPVGIVCWKLKYDYPAVVFLFLSLMYFAKVLSNTTEIAAEHYGPVIGSLLNATFGNLVELIISGTTVSKEDATLTITSLVGSIISNNLFVNGTCFFFGGLEGKPIHEKKPLISHLVFFVCITLLLSMMSVVNDIDTDISDKFKRDTSQIGASLIFVNYLVYLVMNTNEEFKALKVKKAKRDEEEGLVSDSDSDSDSESEDESSVDTNGKEEIPSQIVCFGALALCIAGLGPTANFFVETLKDLTDDKPISKVFIGLIILPLAGSLPEHISSVVAAHKGNMDLSINLAIGSSNQVIGFVLPIIQFISSHYPQTNFNLYLDDYIAAYLFVTAFVCGLCLLNGMAFGVNVFHGCISLTTFAFIVYLTFAND